MTAAVLTEDYNAAITGEAVSALIADRLGKSIAEVMQFSVLEIQTWAAYYRWEYEQTRKTLDGNASNRRSRKR